MLKSVSFSGTKKARYLDGQNTVYSTEYYLLNIYKLIICYTIILSILTNITGIFGFFKQVTLSSKSRVRFGGRGCVTDSCRVGRRAKCGGLPMTC